MLHALSGTPRRVKGGQFLNMLRRFLECKANVVCVERSMARLVEVYAGQLLDDKCCFEMWRRLNESFTGVPEWFEKPKLGAVSEQIRNTTWSAVCTDGSTTFHVLFVRVSFGLLSVQTSAVAPIY